MCGIAGIADGSGLRPNDPSLVDAMLRTLAHRGPDDHLVRKEAKAALGTRRLSIIDVAGGRQPLTNEDGTVIASQNGEIYNYLELRRDLLARGHALQSDGDTETLAHLYEEHGEDLVDHLRGMFAIAIWDTRRNRLVLARDRLGKKPLYWRMDGDRLSYGSELKALLADASMPIEVDREALSLFFGYQYVPSPYTILRGVHKLPPASILVWDGGEPRIERYWAPRYEPKVRRSLEDDRDACLDILREAVRLRLRSDVPVGSFLSGGIDSSIVTALMAEASPEPIRTFTIGFDVPGLDESDHAAAVARHLSTRHTSETITLDPVSSLPQLAFAFDEPFGDASAVPTMRVAELAGQELKVVLTGDGGDELFGGYNRYALDLRIDLWRGLPTPLAGTMAVTAARILGTLAPHSSAAGRGVSAGRMLRRSAADRYDQIMRVMSPELERALMSRPGDRASVGYLAGGVATDGTSNRLDRLLRSDTLNYLPEDVLVKVDRATMASSLEARAPLLDQELVAFAATLPPDRKIRRGESKFLLREVARAILPPEIVARPKHGFSVPINDWFRGPLGDDFHDLALSPDAYLREQVDQDVAASLFTDHRAGLGNNGRTLWQLLMLELWGRRWARSPRPEA